MANLSPVILILILAAAVVVALVIGFFVGSRLAGGKSTAMKKATAEHDDYKSEVREHFQQTSAIMSRMVDDYRDMYQHMSKGADKLADLHREKLITPPPGPEAITRDKSQDANKASASGAAAAKDSAQKNSYGSETSAQRQPSRDDKSASGSDAAKPRTGVNNRSTDSGSSSKPTSSADAKTGSGGSSAGVTASRPGDSAPKPGQGKASLGPDDASRSASTASKSAAANHKPGDDKLN